MTRTIVVAIAGLLGACAVLFRLVHAGDPPIPPPPAAARIAPPAPTAELAALRQQMARLEQQVRTVRQGPPASTAASGAASGAPAAELPASPAEEDRARRDYLAGVDAAFRAEASDAVWSSSVSSVVRAALAADDDLRALARGVECRSRTCRVEITDDGAVKLGKLLPMLVHRLAPDLPNATAQRIDGGGDGPATTVLYLSRPDPGAGS